MIKMYVMQTCPDCEYVEKQVEGASCSIDGRGC